MTKIYFKIFIGIIILIWIIYFLQSYTSYIEPFTPRINSFYRPYVRSFNNNYEYFVNNYGSNVILNKLKKWNIY